MKIKLLVSRSGPDLNQSAGETVDVSEKEGDNLINAGQAVANGGKEQASIGPEETSSIESEQTSLLGSAVNAIKGVGKGGKSK